MEYGAILILCLAAFIHASWNLLAKRGLDNQVFLWLSMAASSVLLFLPAAFLYRPTPRAGLALVLFSGGLEALYVIMLGAAYGSGDFSVVYPVARGSAPIFAAVFSFVFLNESVPPTGIAGVVLAALGVFAVRLDAGGDQRAGPLVVETCAAHSGPPVVETCAAHAGAAGKRLRNRAFLLALVTGAVIGAYSTVDKAGVTYMHPVAYICGAFGISACLLAPHMISKRRGAVVREFEVNRRWIMAVGAMTAASYALVLLSMKWNKAAYVSAVREVSVVFAAILGSVVLRERFTPRKLLGALTIFAGIMLIGLSR
ncbi:MAG: EamA family transporter [Ignavibacteriales bacterium]